MSGFKPGDRVAHNNKPATVVWVQTPGWFEDNPFGVLPALNEIALSDLKTQNESTGLSVGAFSDRGARWRVTKKTAHHTRMRMIIRYDEKAARPLGDLIYGWVPCDRVNPPQQEPA